jgi:hypothetical protein
MINPWFILGAISVSTSAYFWGHHKGWDARDQEMQAQIAKLNEESRSKEQELNKSVTDKSYALRKAQDEITKKQSDISKLVDAGSLRLPSSTSCVQASPDASTSTRDREEARAKLERETIKAIISIATDGDRNTLQLNQCIDTYNQVKEVINGQR